MTAPSRIWRTCWKLTDADYRTHGNCQWGAMVTNPDGVLDGLNGLCSGSFYHAYASPYMAVIMNPEHANITNPVLWLAEYRGTTEDDNGVKFGATELRTIKIVAAPAFTETQLTAFTIFCAALVSEEAEDTVWHEWAVRWLNNEDRSWTAADSAWASASARASASASASARARAWARARASARARVSASASASARASDEIFETAVAWALASSWEDTP